GRVGYAPRVLGHTLQTRKTPAAALLVNMGVGLVALMTGRTGEIITIAVFGALTLYAVSMVAFFRLRQREPDLERPFRTPGYPVVPGIALVLSVVCLVAMVTTNPMLALVYVGLMAAGALWFYVGVPREVRMRDFSRDA
ncbi:MAG: amino acid permease, partial [Myxococcota bacterium]